MDMSHDAFILFNTFQLSLYFSVVVVVVAVKIYVINAF